MKSLDLRPGVGSTAGGLKEGSSGALLRVSTSDLRARVWLRAGKWREGFIGSTVWKVSHLVPRLTQVWASAVQR